MVHIITDKSISVFISGEQKTITSSHPSFKGVKEAIKNNDEEKVKELFNVKRRIESFGQGHVKFENGAVVYKGKALNNYLTMKIVQLQKEGFDINPLLNFVNNIQDNPSYKAREELYQFLEFGKMPITEDGHFVAYKKVRDDYKDIWSGKFDNSIGSVCEMDRREVDDNSNNTCSAGLHFASRGYMKSYGSASANRVVALKINPADVVSIPTDYNNTKGRCCKYEVIADLGDSVTFKELETTAVFEEPKKKTEKGKAVTQMSIKGALIKDWKSAKKAGGKLGIPPTNITAVCRGRREMAGGFKWKYVK